MKNKFVILCFPRTGSYYFTDLLNNQTSVHCHGEIFKEPRVELSDEMLRRMKVKSRHVKRRDRDPMNFWIRVVELSEGSIVGFKLFPRHNVPLLTKLLEDRATKKIFLGRNPIQSHISLLRAKRTNEWVSLEPREVSDDTMVSIVGTELLADILRKKAVYERVVSKALADPDNPIFFVDYSQLVDQVTLDALARFLGLPRWKTVENPKYQKQLRRPYDEAVDNWLQTEELISSWGVSINDNFFDFMDRFDRRLYEKFSSFLQFSEEVET